ncbi:MAG: transporter substrate-binding domain-containing protein, partial [Bacteroidota bacterium]
MAYTYFNKGRGINISMDNCRDLLVRNMNLLFGTTGLLYGKVLFFLLFLGLSRQLNADTLRIGMDFNYPPFSFINEDGFPDGHDVDIIKEISAFTGHKAIFVPGQWEIILEKLKNGEVDVISGIVYSEERDRDYDFTIPIQTVYYSIFANSKVKIHSADDLQGRRGVSLRGDIVNDKFLRPMGLLKDISYVNSLPEALMLVDAGEYDYTLAPYPLGMMVMDEKAVKHVKVAGPPILPSVYCIAVKEGDHELLTMLNHAVSQIRNDGTLDKIDSKWILYKRQDERYKHLLYIVLIILFVLFVVSVMVVVWYYSLRKQVRKETHQIDLVKKNYRNIFNSANDGMIIFDFKGRIVAANPSARNMYAYSEEEMIGLIGR